MANSLKISVLKKEYLITLDNKPVTPLMDEYPWDLFKSYVDTFGVGRVNVVSLQTDKCDE